MLKLMFKFLRNKSVMKLLYQLRIQKKTNDEFCAINFCDNDKIPVPRVQGETPVLCAVTNLDI